LNQLDFRAERSGLLLKTSLCLSAPSSCCLLLRLSGALQACSLLVELVCVLRVEVLEWCREMRGSVRRSLTLFNSTLLLIPLLLIESLCKV